MNSYLAELKHRLFGETSGEIQDQPRSLIAVLLDKNIDWAERDDSAAYLIEYDEPEVEEALFSVASDINEDDDVAGSCGEAVAEIWCRDDFLSIDKIKKLNHKALQEAVGIIGAHKPEWIQILEREGLKGDEYGSFRFDLDITDTPEQEKNNRLKINE